jgi:hypothetical protein
MTSWVISSVSRRLLYRQAPGFEVLDQSLGDSVDIVDIPQVLRELAHQIILVGRGELAAALLVPTLQLIHVRLPPTGTRR